MASQPPWRKLVFQATASGKRIIWRSSRAIKTSDCYLIGAWQVIP